MPLYLVELNRIADSIKASALTCYVHTAAPTDADPDNGRVNSGGFAGVNVPAGNNIARDADGDLTIVGDIDWGAATGAVGTLTHWSLYRGADPVAFGTLPSTTVANGDTFKINGNTLKINGSTS